MSKAVAVKIGKQTILIETDETVEIPSDQAGGAVPGKRIPKDAGEVVNIDDAKRKFAEVKDVIVACCNNLYSAVEKIPAPQRFAIEFGVKLAGEKGIPLLTKVSGEATFKVTVEWKNG